MTTHFGVKPYNKEGGFKLTRDNLINVRAKEISSLSIEELEDQKRKVRDKFDLNMKYFESLSRDNFNEELDKLVETNNFARIVDLNSVNGVSGYYIMVLDDYCQIYIGIARNLRGRIMEHWSKNVPLNKLFSGVETGGLLPIDCFRALDTTRIFVCIGNEDNYSEDNMINMMHEDRLIYQFPVDYCLNIATFWGSREILRERLRNFESRDLKMYGKSHLTTMLDWIDKRLSRSRKTIDR
ncbi:GIY-YIG nuclease family protein [Paenibacillus odorifer]|uniref:GIY-YIG nuclease family protein n=1 Tax=Paenibacillus odorifer TaxID=189426 RepID=UPI00096DB093|nr:GIY-YIG nuclease family protein [Paenibacillus odorifer]OMD76838.1 hypothetical protein BSK50_13885 [Paenibacillus odorifer]